MLKMSVVPRGKADPGTSLLCLMQGMDTRRYTQCRVRWMETFQKVNLDSTIKDYNSFVMGLCGKHKEVTHIVTTDWGLFKELWIGEEDLSGDAISNIGTLCVLKHPNRLNNPEGPQELRIILIQPARFAFVQAGADFYTDRYIAKLVGKDSSIVRLDYMDWVSLNVANYEAIEAAFDHMQKAFLISVDIETTNAHMKVLGQCNPLITSVSYTAGFFNSAGEVFTKTYQVPMDYHDDEKYMQGLAVMRKFNLTSPPKVMQNGMYDASHFLAYNAPLHNYRYDTYHMMHALLPEGRKSLEFISAFFVENFVYWKDESGTNLYRYNAKDTHNTFWVFIGMVKYIFAHAEYGIDNFTEEMMAVFPCIQMGMEGLKSDEETRARLLKEAQDRVVDDEARLQKILKDPAFNCGSPKQVLSMMNSFRGMKRYTSSNEANLKDFADQHPICRIIVDLILNLRGDKKAISTYFDKPTLYGRFMYSIDPAGTETGRASSGESAMWVGANAQNVPPYAREMYVAEDGHVLIGVDKAQSESYCTAYLADDKELKWAVNNSPDFHCHNASMFFGVPFEQLFDEKTSKKLNVPLRNLAKRVNHGANYNMGAFVLFTTMGMKNVLEAQRLLDLPADWSPIKVCDYLLQQFDRTYPKIRGQFQKELIREVLSSGKLVIESIPWTRKTFLQPTKSKTDLNAAVAHKPQALSVRLVNRAMFDIWLNMQHGKYAGTGKFRMKMQVHDEIISSVDETIAEDVAKEMAERMVIPIEIRGDVMSIPSTYAIGRRWSDLKD